MFKTSIHKKTFISFCFLVLSLALATSQTQDTTLQAAFYLTSDATLEININHSDVVISPSEDDSIRINCNIVLIPNNINTPFNGISIDLNHKDSTNVFLNIHISPEIQPHNQLQSSCQISLPKGTNLNINGRYSKIDLSHPFKTMEANLEYCILRTPALNSQHKHQITGNYTDLFIDKAEGTLALRGTSLKLKSNTINQLTTDLKFSTLTIQRIKSLSASSYSDKYTLGNIDSLIIKGEYSSVQVENLNRFYQGDLSYGALIINYIDISVSEINIANNYVTTQLYYPAKSSFSLNADMRYCELKAPNIKLESITAPSGQLFKGERGNKALSNLKLSIISSFGDVSINQK